MNEVYTRYNLRTTRSLKCEIIYLLLRHKLCYVYSSYLLFTTGWKLNPATSLCMQYMDISFKIFWKMFAHYKEVASGSWVWMLSQRPFSKGLIYYCRHFLSASRTLFIYLIFVKQSSMVEVSMREYSVHSSADRPQFGDGSLFYTDSEISKIVCLVYILAYPW